MNRSLPPVKLFPTRQILLLQRSELFVRGNNISTYCINTRYADATPSSLLKMYSYVCVCVCIY